MLQFHIHVYIFRITPWLHRYSHYLYAQFTYLSRYLVYIVPLKSLKIL